MEYGWDFRGLLRYREAFLSGTLITLKLTFWCIIFGTLLGGCIAFLRQRRTSLLRLIAGIYIEIFRALPLLVLLVWLYYCLPIISGLKFDNFTTALIAMSVNLSAFAAETIRSSVESIPKGQNEAGLALGLKSWQVFLRIVLPQAAKVMIPNMLGLYITMLKMSSLASVIAVYELLHTANNLISQVYRPLEIYTIIAMIYLIIVLPVAYYAGKIEKRIKLG
jgi:polar amino acid transport system permease protein